MKKRYILLKDTPELRKGAIIEEECEGGSQDYRCQDKRYLKFPKNNSVLYYKDTVEKSSDWFEEMGIVEMSIKHVAKVKKFVKSLK